MGTGQKRTYLASVAACSALETEAVASRCRERCLRCPRSRRLDVCLRLPLLSSSEDRSLSSDGESDGDEVAVSYDIKFALCLWRERLSLDFRLCSRRGPRDRDLERSRVRLCPRLRGLLARDKDLERSRGTLWRGSRSRDTCWRGLWSLIDLRSGREITSDAIEGASDVALIVGGKSILAGAVASEDALGVAAAGLMALATLTFSPTPLGMLSVLVKKSPVAGSSTVAWLMASLKMTADNR